jgi:hypothetical protein
LDSAAVRGQRPTSARATRPHLSILAEPGRLPAGRRPRFALGGPGHPSGDQALAPGRFRGGRGDETAGIRQRAVRCPSGGPRRLAHAERSRCRHRRLRRSGAATASTPAESEDSWRRRLLYAQGFTDTHEDVAHLRLSALDSERRADEPHRDFESARTRSIRMGTSQHIERRSARRTSRGRFVPSGLAIPDSGRTSTSLSSTTRIESSVSPSRAYATVSATLARSTLYQVNVVAAMGGSSRPLRSTR